MSEVVLDNQGSSGSTWRRSRVGLLLSTAVVTALYCLCAGPELYRHPLDEVQVKEIMHRLQQIVEEQDVTSL